MTNNSSLEEELSIYLENKCRVISENEIFPKSLMDSAQFEPTVKDMIDSLNSDTDNECYVLCISYFKNDKEKLKLFLEYLNKHSSEYYPILFKDDTNILLYKKSDSILMKFISQDKDEETNKNMHKILEDRVSNIIFQQIDSLCEEFFSDDDEIYENKEEILLPKIEEIKINNITESSFIVEFNKIERALIEIKNKLTIVQKYKNENIGYILFLNQQGQFEYTPYKNYYEKDNKIYFKIENLKSNSIYLIRLSITLGKYFSIPEKYFYLYTKCSDSDLKYFFAYGKADHNSLIFEANENTESKFYIKPEKKDIFTFTKIVEDNKTEENKLNEFYFINTPLQLYTKISSFSYFNEQTLITLKDGTIINSGKAKMDLNYKEFILNNENIKNTVDVYSSPYCIQIPNTQYIRKVAVGLDHCAALNNYGEVFTWGQNMYGQLGLNVGKDIYVGTPSKVAFQKDSDSSFFVTDIQCGSNHCLVSGISKLKMKLYAWGDAFGTEKPFEPLDMINNTLTGCSSIPILIEFDHSHSIKKIYSKWNSNAIICYNKNGNDLLYTFGFNILGQLGFSNLISEKQMIWVRPYLIEYFSKNNYHVEDIKFSSTYSIVLTKNENGKDLFLSGQFGDKIYYDTFTKINLDVDLNDIECFDAAVDGIVFYLKSGKIRIIRKDNLLIIESYEKLQKLILLSQIVYAFKDNYSLCQKYINNIYKFYGIDKKEDDICLYNILPELMMRLIINHKKEKNIITLLSSLSVQLIKGYSNNNNYEKDFTNYINQLITSTNFICKSNIYTIQNFINYISIYITNLPKTKADILSIDLDIKDIEEKYIINYTFFKKCLAEKISNLITKEAFEQLANSSYSQILEEISLEPTKPEGLSKDFDIISESIKKKEQFSEFKSQLISEDGELIYNFIAAILITRSKTLSHLSETINLYNEDLYELKSKNPNKFEMFIIKCIFDIYANSNVHVLFLIEKFYNKYLISHLNVLKFIFIEKFSQNKENISNWVLYDIIDFSISNAKFLIGKISEELKNEQENLTKSDEDKRQDIIKKIENLEAIQDKIKNENQCLCSEIFKRFNDLVQGYKRLGEDDIIYFIKSSILFFNDICVNKNNIDLDEWKDNKSVFCNKDN